MNHFRARCPKCQQVFETVERTNLKSGYKREHCIPKHQKYNRSSARRKRCAGSFKTANAAVRAQ